MKLVIVPQALSEFRDAASEELLVLAVAHHRRRPGYWLHRK